MGNKHFRTAFDFVRAKADAYVRCECGHTRTIGCSSIVSVFGPETRLQGMEARLRCSLCGERGKARIAPVPRGGHG